MTTTQSKTVIEVCDIRNYLGGNWVHDGVSFSVDQGEVIAIIGASGGGKTTLLRNILMLLRPSSGSIKVFDTDILSASLSQKKYIRSRWGVMFQNGALFGSMTIYENILMSLNEFTDLSRADCRDIVMMKLALVGLPLDVAMKYPAQLSGGMIKRAAVARAIALDPDLLFFDEPTSGLDPQSACELDDLVLHLKYNVGLTVVFVTHDLDTLWRVPDKIVFLGEGKVVAVEPMEQMVTLDHPLVQGYFENSRAQSRRQIKESNDG